MTRVWRMPALLLACLTFAGASTATSAYHAFTRGDAVDGAFLGFTAAVCLAMGTWLMVAFRRPPAWLRHLRLTPAPQPALVCDRCGKPLAPVPPLATPGEGISVAELVTIGQIHGQWCPGPPPPAAVLPAQRCTGVSSDVEQGGPDAGG